MNFPFNKRYNDQSKVVKSYKMTNIVTSMLKFKIQDLYGNIAL